MIFNFKIIMILILLFYLLYSVLIRLFCCIDDNNFSLIGENFFLTEENVERIVDRFCRVRGVVLKLG